MLVRESLRCMQKYIVDPIGKDQAQISRVIDKLIIVRLLKKSEGRRIAQ